MTLQLTTQQNPELHITVACPVQREVRVPTFCLARRLLTELPLPGPDHNDAIVWNWVPTDIQKIENCMFNNDKDKQTNTVTFAVIIKITMVSIKLIFHSSLEYVLFYFNRNKRNLHLEMLPSNI